MPGAGPQAGRAQVTSRTCPRGAGRGGRAGTLGLRANPSKLPLGHQLPFPIYRIQMKEHTVDGPRVPARARTWRHLAQAKPLGSLGSRGLQFSLYRVLAEGPEHR